MWLTGKDVWGAIMNMGWSSEVYELSYNRNNADLLAGLLNDVLQKRRNWLPGLIQTEDAMRAWEANTPREYVLRLYKYLNQCGGLSRGPQEGVAQAGWDSGALRIQPREAGRFHSDCGGRKAHEPWQRLHRHLVFYGPRGGEKSPLGIEREHIVANFYGFLLEWAEQGKFRQYKRIICFDHDVLANDHELRSGVLRIGEGPGTIDRTMGVHCRQKMRTKGCSLYVAPVVFRSVVVFFGADKVCITVETAAPDTGDRATAALIFFCDPPNGEMIEQFRQIERATERHMVAVHKIRFPEDAEPTGKLATR